jgi:hypothetical protein
LLCQKNDHIAEIFGLLTRESFQPHFPLAGDKGNEKHFQLSKALIKILCFILDKLGKATKLSSVEVNIEKLNSHCNDSRKGKHQRS